MCTARGRRKSGLLQPSVALKLSVSPGSPNILVRVLLAGTSELPRQHAAENLKWSVHMMVKSDQSMKKHDSSLINYWCTQVKHVINVSRVYRGIQPGKCEAPGLMFLSFVGWIIMPSSSSPWQQSPQWRRLRTTIHLCSLLTSRQTNIKSNTLSRSCTTLTSPKSTLSSGNNHYPN